METDLLSVETLIQLLEAVANPEVAKALAHTGGKLDYRKVVELVTPSVIIHLRELASLRSPWIPWPKVDLVGPRIENPYNPHKFVSGTLVHTLPRTATEIPPFPVDKTDAHEARQDASRFDGTTRRV